MDMNTGAARIADERQRQIEQENYSTRHDDHHINEEIASAAVCYALPLRFRHRRVMSDTGSETVEDMLWPADWGDPRKKLLPARNSHFEEDDIVCRIRNLTKAGALIAAEIDRLVRLQHGG